MTRRNGHLALAMTERQLQDSIVELAHLTHWLCFHVLDSRKSMGVGYPDLTLAHEQTGALLFVELKSTDGRVTAEQRRWLDVLGRKHWACVWRPEDWRSGHIRDVLTHPAQFVSPSW